ncbi:hypothetical protein ACOSQ4_024742 [Xanthoceras sorbifolium]
MEEAFLAHKENILTKLIKYKIAKSTCQAHVSWFNEQSGQVVDTRHPVILCSGFGLFETGMGSDVPAPLVDKVNVLADASLDGHCATKKNKGKVPKRIHKAEREKLKREQLNELFLDLANVLELTQQNNGKAAVVCEATRLLKDLFCQIESLRKEKASLLSESHYVTVEKNELVEENSALESQIEKLQTEIEARIAHSKPDLNVPPEFQQPELTSHFPVEGYGLPSVETSLQQAPAVLVVPIRSSNIQAYSTSNASQLTSNPASKVSKPHARYLKPSDSWPSQLLGESIVSTTELNKPQ